MQVSNNDPIVFQGYAISHLIVGGMDFGLIGAPVEIQPGATSVVLNGGVGMVSSSMALGADSVSAYLLQCDDTNFTWHDANYNTAAQIMSYLTGTAANTAAVAVNSYTIVP